MTDYTKLKVADLKALLKDRDIPPTGLTKKQQLIDALEANDAGTGNDEDEDVDDAPTNGSAFTAQASKFKKRPLSPSPANDGPKKQPKKADLAAESKSKVADAQFATSTNVHVSVDEGCHLSSYHVYVDNGDGIIYDASLNQTNASNNNNKFYRVQVRSCSLPCCAFR